MHEGFLPQDSFRDLVQAAVERIVVTDDLDGFLAWFNTEVYQRRLLARTPLDASESKAVAAQLGRSLWEATPAPHNDFRPQPLPKPGRNEPCYCGSGVKYKRCCARFPTVPAMGSAEVWPIVLDALPRQDCRQVVASGGVPVESLIVAAEESRALGRSARAIGFLEPIFGDKIAGTGQQYDHALSLLCDLYDDEGRTRKKAGLLERIVTEVPRSALRSGAYQRMATIRMDRGDPAGAWDAFRRAQRDAPGNPAVGLLEVHLLLAENRPERARESARVWRRRLMKLNVEEFEGAIGFLTAVDKDPYGALAETLIDATGGAGQRLLEALSRIERRPLPPYEVAAVPALDPGADPELEIATQMRGMGVSEKDIRAMASELLEQTRNLERGDGPPDEAVDSLFTLETPEPLRVLEADWHAIYSPGKPFSIDEVPRQAAFPWDPDAEDVWMGFLDRHSEAFDSVDVLDDLATAVELHPMSDSQYFREAMQATLVERGARILRQAVEEAGPPGDRRLRWADARNRPGLRCLARAQSLAMERGDTERARAHAELLLALNPYDNHGVRTSLMNIYLTTGQDEAAVALVVEPPRNEWSVVAGRFRARRGRADVGDLLQAAATPRGAFRRPPEGRAHKRPSALLSALDVCPIRPRADAAHLDACGRADHSFLGGSTTSMWSTMSRSDSFRPSASSKRASRVNMSSPGRLRRSCTSASNRASMRSRARRARQRRVPGMLIRLAITPSSIRSVSR